MPETDGVEQSVRQELREGKAVVWICVTSDSTVSVGWGTWGQKGGGAFHS